MADINSISKQNLELAKISVMQIAELAHTIRNLTIDIIDDGVEGFDSLKVVAARELSSQLGWLADVTSGLIGGVKWRGDAESWMLPPAFHAQKSAEVSHE